MPRAASRALTDLAVRFPLAAGTGKEAADAAFGAVPAAGGDPGVTSITSSHRLGNSWSERTIRLVWRAWTLALLVLLAMLASLVGLWISGRQSLPTPVPSVAGRVSALYPEMHYACFSTAQGRTCGEVFSQVPLRLGESVRLSAMTISTPGGTATALVVVRPLG